MLIQLEHMNLEFESPNAVASFKKQRGLVEAVERFQVTCPDNNKVCIYSTPRSDCKQPRLTQADTTQKRHDDLPSQKITSVEKIRC